MTTRTDAVLRQAITLSDGRSMIYFDRRDGLDVDRVDHRDLSAVRPGSELRYDPGLDDWVVVAAHRQGRVFQPARVDCPLCPSGPDHRTEVPGPDYDVVVFENRFPALSGAGPVADHATDPLLHAAPGAGRCEVICFSPDHQRSFADLSTAQAATVMTAWVDRTRALSDLPEVAQVYCFENRGAEIGVTLDHPHGQIYGYPFVPHRTARMIQAAGAYHRRTLRNVFDDLVAAELADGRRVVRRSEHWVAFVPFAARWPYEVHLHPLRRVPDLPALSEEAQADFGDVYLDVLRRFDRLFGGRTPYISAWHQAPVRTGRQHLALHLELFTVRRAADKLKYLAGSESGMDVVTNDIEPEAAAATLRALA